MVCSCKRNGWNGRVTLSTYKAFEGTMFTMGSGGAPPEPKSYRFFANIDGYNNVFIRVEYAEKYFVLHASSLAVLDTEY